MMKNDMEMKTRTHTGGMCYVHFFLLSLHVIICESVRYTTETKEFVVGLAHNGNLLDTYKVPTCGSDQKINLVSYMYHLRQCEFVGDCISTHEEPLHSTEEYFLHEMCSLKQKCKTLSFPLRSEAQRNRTNSITIKYECIDTTELSNICVKADRIVTDVVCLTSVGITKRFSDCQCFVNNGSFSLSIADLRLKANIEDKCSPAILHINNQEFSCDQHRDDYGSIFKRRLGRPQTNAYISLNQNSDTGLPDSVLIKLQPDSSLKLKCIGQSSTQTANVNGFTSTTRRTGTSEIRSTTPVSTIKEVRKLCALTSSLKKSPLEDTVNHLAIAAMTSNLVVILFLLIYFYLTSKQKQFCCSLTPVLKSLLAICKPATASEKDKKDDAQTIEEKQVMCTKTKHKSDMATGSIEVTIETADSGDELIKDDAMFMAR